MDDFNIMTALLQAGSVAAGVAYMKWLIELAQKDDRTILTDCAMATVIVVNLCIALFAIAVAVIVWTRALGGLNG